MSELKAYRVKGVTLGDTHDVYLKSEADKVIAEKDAEIAILKSLKQALMADDLRYRDKIRHHKHKRCLANAEACMHQRWRTDDGFDYARSHRHMNKWLAIADKFKEAK